MTLWNVTASRVRLTDELPRPRTPCGVRPRDRDTGVAAGSRERLDPRVHACHDNGAQSGYGLMNQPCQRFTGGPQPSPTPRLAAAPGPAQPASQRPPQVAAQGSVEEAPPLQRDSIATELGAVCGMSARSKGAAGHEYSCRSPDLRDEIRSGRIRDIAGEDTRAEDARPPSLVVVAAAIVEPGQLLVVSKKDALACSASAAGSFTGLGLRP